MHLMKTHPNGDNEKTEKKRESKRFGQHFNRGWRGPLLERLLYSFFIFAQKHPGWQLSQFRKQDKEVHTGQFQFLRGHSVT